MTGLRAARRRGFTLVEVLVAIFVMSLMAALAWQGIDGMVRTREASQQRLESLLRVQTVLAQWEQDLSQVQETLAVPALAFDGATLRLTRRQPDGMQLVAWSLRGGAWLRWAGSPVTTQRELQDDWLRSQQFLGNEPGQLRTLAGVAQWQMFCFRGNAWSNCQSDADVVTVAGATPGGGTGQAPGGAAATTRQLLPTGVRLVLSFGEGSDVPGSVVRDSLLGPQVAP
jgi:general secretion pathway protein J